MNQSKPSIYIPTLYFAEGLPYTVVNMMSVVFFKNLGASNQFIGLTSFLYIPWVIKLFWAPLVDLYGSKRNWILICQTSLTVLFLILALGTTLPQAIVPAVCIMVVIAFLSATQDIAIDGYYLEVLNKDEQALYVGIRNAAYKIAWLLGAGGLVYLAGSMGKIIGLPAGWSISFAVCAALCLATLVFHSVYLPQPTGQKLSRDGGLPAPGAKDSITAVPTSSLGQLFWRVFASYFKQPGIIIIVFYIVSFRLGDALMLKMAQPFLLDKLAAGGMAISTADVGLIYGTVGMIFLILGGILGGWLIAVGGLKKWLWPTALIQNSAILLYWLLAIFRPGLALVAAVNSAEQFAYGLGVSAYTVFLLKTVKSEYKAAHYAIATALMALGMMLPGAISGYLQAALGYANFFAISFIASIPGIIAIFFLPLNQDSSESSSLESTAAC